MGFRCWRYYKVDISTTVSYNIDVHSSTDLTNFNDIDVAFSFHTEQNLELLSHVIVHDFVA